MALLGGTTSLAHVGRVGEYLVHAADANRFALASPVAAVVEPFAERTGRGDSQRGCCAA